MAFGLRLSSSSCCCVKRDEPPDDSIKQLGPPPPADRRWSVYLLVSRTRSSLVGSAPCAEISRPLAWHNGETGEEGPQETAPLRPWRLAKSCVFPSRAEAQRAARLVSRGSGFRSRLAALRLAGKEANGLHNPGGEQSVEAGDLDLQAALDGLTYVPVEFLSPQDSSKAVTVLALVDTGSQVCDLRQSLIEELCLPRAGGGNVLFETAAGLHTQSVVYGAVVRVLGREAAVKVSPAEEADEESVGGEASDGAAKAAGVEVDGEEDDGDVDRAFGFGSSTDDAVLGYDALAALGLLVDCQSRRLMHAPPSAAEAPLSALPFLSSRACHVPLELISPTETSARTVAHALVDTGSTDVELRQCFIDELRLKVDASEGSAQFETAGGVTVEAPIYRAVARLLGREASVRVSPSFEDDEADEEDEEDEFKTPRDVEDGAEVEEDKERSAGAAPGSSGSVNASRKEGGGCSDDSLLGHDALAALGLLVDCRGRQLLALPELPVRS